MKTRTILFAAGLMAVPAIAPVHANDYVDANAKCLDKMKRAHYNIDVLDKCMSDYNQSPIKAAQADATPSEPEQSLAGAEEEYEVDQLRAQAEAENDAAFDDRQVRDYEASLPR